MVPHQPNCEQQRPLGQVPPPFIALHDPSVEVNDAAPANKAARMVALATARSVGDIRESTTENCRRNLREIARASGEL